MLVGGIWATLTIGEGALQRAANPILVRCGQGIALGSILIFLYPFVAQAFGGGR